MAEQVEWKEIDGFERYEVSNDGRVRNKMTGDVLKPARDQNNYRSVLLYRSGKQTRKKLHRLVASAFVANPDNKPEVDHIDNDKSNNHYTNLRFATRHENNFNTQKRASASSRYKGVCRDSKHNKWLARIQVGGLRINIGSYDDEIEAAICYDAYAVELHKSFARTNTYDDKSDHSDSEDEDESPSDGNRNDVD